MNANRRTVLRAIGASSIGTAATTLTSGSAAAATVITVRGAGSDIWGTADEGYFYYGEVGGDFDVTVRNTYLENTSAYAKAGIMVRDSLDADAKNVLIRRNPDGQASLQWRPSVGADAVSTTSGGEQISEVDGGSIQADWLRLSRNGDTFTAYGSTDGSNWTRIGQLTTDQLSLSSDTYVGLPVTSHNEGTLCTAEYRDLSGVSPTSSQNLGNPDVSGSVSVAKSVPIVTTQSATDVTHDSATLHGSLEDLGGGSSADCYFEYREVPTDSWRSTDPQTFTSPTSFSQTLDELSMRTYYEVRAVVDASDGDTNKGGSVYVGTPSPANGGHSHDHRHAGPASLSKFAPDDGFASVAPWLDDDVPVIRITEAAKNQFERAIHVEGPRIVAFETSGTIDLKKDHLTVKSDKLYIAGQTAPSPGITLIRGDLTIDADDCVVQHIRVRAGDAHADVGWEPDGIRTEDDTSNNVIDHCSVSWSVDEALSAGYRTNDTTIANCLIAEPLNHSTHHKGAHGYGSLIGNDAKNVAMLGNIWAFDTDRNPRLKKGTETVVVNCLDHSYHDGMWADPDTAHSIVGNVFEYPTEDKPNIYGDASTTATCNATPT